MFVACVCMHVCSVYMYVAYVGMRVRTFVCIDLGM
jgi:hypothetical protein